MPEGSQWHHVGHTIVINEQHQHSATSVALDSSSVTISSPSPSSSSNMEVNAYRFDNKRTSTGAATAGGVSSNLHLFKTLSKKIIQHPQNLLKSTKMMDIHLPQQLSTTHHHHHKCHQMEMHLSCLIKIGRQLNVPWVDSFVGMDGPGVYGIGKECRNIV
mmetsp:Transcript_26196/g.38651  ORF Transcript_26196/g.38651 Transcript_26196/m.38651 type:complete len:160 (-) Transcript_26196:142-621(-)